MTPEGKSKKFLRKEEEMEDEFKKKCDDCGEIKDILKIERMYNYEKRIFSCSHEKKHSISVKGAGLVIDSEIRKYFPLFNQLIRNEQRRAIVNINRKEEKISLKIEEQNEKGEWVKVGYTQEKCFL